MFAASRIVFIRFFFFFNDTATTEIYTLSLHDALPITSRPLLLYAVGRQIRHANQTSITITSTHGKAGRVRRMLAEVAAFFKSLRPTAEQLTDLEPMVPNPQPGPGEVPQRPATRTTACPVACLIPPAKREDGPKPTAKFTGQPPDLG